MLICIESHRTCDFPGGGQGFFSGVSGAVIRPLSQWQMPTFFPNLNKKKSQSDGNFYVNQYI